MGQTPNWGGLFAQSSPWASLAVAQECHTDLPAALRYLSDVNPCLLDLERAKLTYQVENSDGLFSATKLGKTVCLTGVAPESGAIVGAFLRALIHMSEKSREINEGASSVNYMRRLTDIDLLFLSVVSYEVRDNIPGRLSQNDRGRITEYIEQLPQEDKPLVNLWRSGTSNEYPTRRLLS
jgi:hypothetical protein